MGGGGMVGRWDGGMVGQWGDGTMQWWDSGMAGWWDGGMVGREPICSPQGVRTGGVKGERRGRAELDGRAMCQPFHGDLHSFF